MGHQQSTIDRLPEEIRDQLNELLRDPAVTQKDAVERINAILAKIDHPESLSKSAVNRYAMRMEKIGRRMRESREMADIWISKFGAAPQGKVGNLINEMLRTLSFDISLILQEGHIDEETAPGVVDMLKDLALTTMRLEKAANLNVEREKEIRQQALEEAANSVEKAASQRGMTKEDAQFWREQVLGIR